GGEIIGVAREETEHGRRAWVGGGVLRQKQRPAPVLKIDPEHAAIPVTHRIAVARLEEDAANAKHLCHSLASRLCRSCELSPRLPCRQSCRRLKARRAPLLPRHLQAQGNAVCRARYARRARAL